MTNRCTSCGSEDITTVETQEREITETCNNCQTIISYDRIKVGSKAPRDYIEAINHALILEKQQKVMITGVGKRRLTILDALYKMNTSVRIVDCKQQQTELGKLELRLILEELKKK